MDLPLPIATLLRRARNAKSPKERHDTAYFAWEASIRLAVAARPPSDAAGLAMPSTGHWVAAFEGTDALLDQRALLAAFAVLAEVGLAKKSAPKAVTAKSLLEPLPAYRNQVIGHGSTRAADFYDRAAGALLDGLEAADGSGYGTSPPNSGQDRVFRGGSWYYDAGYCRAAVRRWSVPAVRVAYVSVRPA